MAAPLLESPPLTQSAHRLHIQPTQYRSTTMLANFAALLSLALVATAGPIQKRDNFVATTMTITTSVPTATRTETGQRVMSNRPGDPSNPGAGGHAGHVVFYTNTVTDYATTTQVITRTLTWSPPTSSSDSVTKYATTTQESKPTSMNGATVPSAAPTPSKPAILEHGIFGLIGVLQSLAAIATSVPAKP